MNGDTLPFLVAYAVVAVGSWLLCRRSQRQRDCAIGCAKASATFAEQLIADLKEVNTRHHAALQMVKTLEQNAKAQWECDGLGMRLRNGQIEVLQAEIKRITGLYDDLYLEYCGALSPPRSANGRFTRRNAA
jgi:hypothetical protein